VQAVDIGEILRVMRLNVELAQAAVAGVAQAVALRRRTCSCGSALKDGIITDRAAIPAAAVERLRPIVGKYL
jgi:5'-methylthioadenosine phosphorylase